MAIFRGRIIGCLALVALAITQLHAVWALCCIGEATTTVAAVSFDLSDGPHHPAAPYTSTGEVSEPAPGPSGHGVPDCPPLQAGCTVVATLPPVPPTGSLARPESDAPVAIAATLPHLLLGDDLFHPPRL